MVETINEKVSVEAEFNLGKVRPLRFLWNNRGYPVRSIHLIHKSREGFAEIYYFSVSDGVNVFKLVFNSSTLNWVLEEIYI